MHTPPRLIHSITEIPRAITESAQLARQYPNLSRKLPKGQGPVICIPGYGTGDSAMMPLRSFLKSLGYTPLRSNIGFNLESRNESIMSIEDAVDYRDKMAERLKSRIEKVHDQHGENVSLIGWSMGGLFATDVARLVPEKIQQIITLGSPFGDPRGTALFNVMRQLKRNRTPIESENFDAWLSRKNLSHDSLPVTVVYSKKDGIVGSGCAQLDEHKSVVHVEVDSSHMGFVTNPRVYSVVANSLRENLS